MAEEPTGSQAIPGAPKPGPRRRRGRRALLILAATAGIAVAGWALLTRSFITRWVGTSILSSRIGVPVYADAITLSAGGLIEVRGLVVRAPGVDGDAGQFARADRLEVRAPWWRGLWGGDVALRRVEVTGLLVRVSQSLDDQSANIPPFRIGGGSKDELPVVVIKSGHFELGEHKQEGFRVLRTLELTGDLSPASTLGEYSFDLRQTQAGFGTLSLTGSITPKVVKARLDGLALDVLTPESVPGPLRALIKKLALAGRVAGTTFEYQIPEKGAPSSAKVRGIDASIELQDVAVTLPFEDLSSAAPAGSRYPRLSAVSGVLGVKNGEVTAKLIGRLEDLPAEVSLAWKGTALDSPFEAIVATSGFRLSPNPRLLPFMPPIVHERLGMFSNPSGIVDSRVVVTRGAGEAAPTVTGTIMFKEGRASFVRFPYEFKDMTALFEFDESSLRILRIDGRADNGATIHLRGLITPLTDEASVKLDIEVKGVLVDESLAAGLGPRSGVLDALFNTTRRDELLAAGLIVSAAEAEARASALLDARSRVAAVELAGGAVSDKAREELKIAESRAAVPAFELGGRGNVTLKMETPFGRRMPWTQLIEIDIPRAGMLPKRFPLPIVARDVKLLVDDTVLSIEGGSFSALRGGEATVHVRADFSTAPAEAGTEPRTPQRETDINISAKGMPFDELLINAIPANNKSLGGTGEDARSLGDALRGLQIRGTGDAEIWIGDTAPGEIGFKARVTLNGASCAPTETPLLSSMSGTIDVDDRSFAMDLGANIGQPDAKSDAAQGRVSIEASATFPGGEVAPTFESRIGIVAFDTRIDVERLVSQFSPPAGRSISQLRERFQPTGVVDLRTHVWDDGAGPVKVQVEASAGRNVELTYAPALPPGVPPAEPVRIAMSPWSGLLRFEAGAGSVASRLTFDTLKSEVSVPSTTLPSASLTLNGTLEIIDGIDAGALSIEMTGARFESPLTRAVMAERLSPDFASFLHGRNPRGIFNVSMNLKRPGLPDRSSEAVPWDVRGDLTLRTLAIHGETVDVDCPSATGIVRFTREGGTFERLNLVNPEWSVGIEGSWSIAADGAPTLRAMINGESMGVPPSLMSLFPLAVRDLAASVDLKSDGKFEFRNVDLSLHWPAPGSVPAGPVPAFSVSGALGFADLSADVGVIVTKAAGSFAFESSRSAAGVVTYSATADVPQASAASVALTNVSARLVSGANPGETLVPYVHASCHGGSLSVEASLRPIDPKFPDGPKGFETLVGVGGVALNGVMGDLSPGRTSIEPSPLIDGSITLGGTAGNIGSRRGRGTLTAGGGAVIDMPVLLPLISFSNLQLPVGEQLDTALASFFVTGPTVAIERVSVLSPGLELRGFGTVTWPAMDLNLVFNSRSSRRVPIITPIIETFRNELVTTVVRGTATQPKISLEPFRTARSALSGIFADKSEADLIMSTLESRSDTRFERGVPSTPGPIAPK